MKRTVADLERITRECVRAPPPKKRTPFSRSPSVAPVAANMMSRSPSATKSAIPKTRGRGPGPPPRARPPPPPLPRWVCVSPPPPPPRRGGPPRPPPPPRGGGGGGGGGGGAPPPPPRRFW